jgi:poly(3-hydroxybutyrate) depolymerase/6-phosphogluconolactonase (cycloisomerase 2 family)
VSSAAGRLTFVQPQRDGLPGPDHRLIGLAVSPDGVHVYVSGPGTENDVAVFARDAVTGMLSPIEVVSTGLPPTYEVRVSPDGAQVYAAGPTAKALTAFQRDPATGRLTRLASWRNGVDNVQGLDGAQTIALSVDGASLYVAGFYDHAVAVFARDLSTGSLSFVQVVQSGVEGVQGLKGARGVVVSPDGAHLWAAGWADKAIALFSRDPNTGRLGFVEVRRNVVAEWVGMGEMNRLARSPDGTYLYGASSSYNALLVFSTGKGGMAPIVRCVGDCDSNSQVTIDDVLEGVNVALGNLPFSSCEMFDDNGDGTVTVEELLRGVNNALNGCADPLTPGDHRRTLQLGGYSRIYDVHVPPGYDGNSAVPLVLDFHGSALNQTDQAGVSGWRALADRERFIVAYPLGLFGQPEAPEVDTHATLPTHGPAFNAGPLCCGLARTKGIDDVGFARAIVQAVAAEANVDRARSAFALTLICAAFLIAGAQAARAGLNVWTTHDPYGGLPITALAVDPQTPNTLYAGTDGGIFQSTNSGGSWRAVNSCLGGDALGVRVLAMDAMSLLPESADGEDLRFRGGDGR